MTEDLRRQTQERVDVFVHARLKGSRNKIEKPTNINDDFSSKFKHLHNENVTYKDQSIWVIKKNKTVLENLILWFHEQIKNQGEEILKQVPVLIIDDEADNASIQSLSTKHFNEWEVGLEVQNKDKEELTDLEQKQLELAQESVIRAINRNIRVLLSLIGSKTFVAYTATPYSVVTQAYGDVLDRKAITIKGIDFKITAGDLFPKDFILPIRPGKTYLGIESCLMSMKIKTFLQLKTWIKNMMKIMKVSSPQKEEVNMILKKSKKFTGCNYSFYHVYYN